MPIKFGQPLDVTIGIPKEDGTVEYEKLNSITSIEESELSQEVDERLVSMTKTWEGSFELYSPIPKALYYFFVYGNDLYLRFPKKLRRKNKCANSVTRFIQ